MLLEQSLLRRRAFGLRCATRVAERVTLTRREDVQAFVAQLFPQRFGDGGQAAFEGLDLAVNLVRAPVVGLAPGAAPDGDEAVVGLDPSVRAVGGIKDSLQAVILLLADRLELV